MKNFFVLILSASLLSGCVFIVGAAAGGAVVGAVYDHRKLESITNDTKLSNQIVNKINANPNLGSDTHINVTVYNHTILLTGEVSNGNQKADAEAAVHEVPQVEKVYNELAIQGPTSNLTRASDSWITTKVRTQMLAAKGLKSGTIKIITENGSVYLLGQVSRDQADQAVDIARKVSGVQKVVKIFDYTS